ncbi:hypothetical protein Dsin_016198 [Dipteronia sinensis]|uniref:Uncharacterized protein n=1 Tax=Dipteronia sinensis TaxID=43782 RepID=A0AAE0E5H6_9ROSI|nr:hypothetical protein Dsin_016198 [Dipteronia sinensis]
MFFILCFNEGANMSLGLLGSASPASPLVLSLYLKINEDCSIKGGLKFGDFSVIVGGITGTGRMDFAKIHCCVPSLKHRDSLVDIQTEDSLNGIFELFIYVSSG